MKKCCLGLIAGLFALPVMAAGTCMQRSDAVLAALNAGNYQLATKHFDAQMQAALPAAKLKQVWSDVLPVQLGIHDPDAKGQVARAVSPTQIVTPLHFTNGWLNMEVSCDANGKVAGLYFKPGSAPESAKPAPARKPVSASWGRSIPTEVKSPLGPLPATLTVPEGKGPFPAVVLVAGSGAHDRDETIGPNKPFRDIARGLAKAGVASLRYDKRSFAYSAKVAGNKSLTVDDEVTDDALGAVRQLATSQSINPHRVFVLGHSLGAMMAPRIGKRDSNLAGLILMAAPARPLLDVSAQQVREQGQRQGATRAEIAKDEQTLDAERKLLAKADPEHPPKGDFGGVPQSYWLSLHNYDQVAVARSLSLPMLILQGGADFQVSPKADYARWKQALKSHTHVDFRLYPGLSHLFMPAGKTQTIADYKQPGHVDSQVISDIATWIKAQPANGEQ